MTGLARSASRTPSVWWVAVVAGMASYIDAAALVANGIALVIYQHTVGVTPGEIGILSAALTFSVAIGALVGGRLGDRFGRRPVFLVTLALIVIGGTLLIFGTSLPLLLIGEVLVGLGIGADIPVSVATISEAASDKNRGAVVVLSSLLWGVGILATIVISSFVGGMGYLGGQILYAHFTVIALIVLLLRLGIPESETWKVAREERRHGVETIRADKTAVRDLFRAPYIVPFLALLAFATLTNLAANTSGQFNAYVAVNLAGVSVEAFSQAALWVFPVALLAGIWFMKVVDGPHRMRYYAAGGVMMVSAYLIPVVFGFNFVSIVAVLFLSGVGNAFAFDAIKRVWTQESFPTMLRSSAQGGIDAVARTCAALLAAVTPALLAASPQLMYLSLAIVTAIGLLIAWITFRKRTRNEFDVEQELDPDAEAAQPVPE
ncbi:MFS transporter [Microbacterium sp. B2969]|uniref:MFS transporter n=1 Tax=Microbacterium alkaliflavum TaxID=3248839 RepID=A0ABW7QFL0_9MICO